VSGDEVQRLYSVMDVLAYPRRRLRVTELVTPLKPLEAMAMEKAVIGSDVGGIRELIQHGVTGLVHRSGDVADLAATITHLADDPNRRKQLGQQGREWVTRHRDWRHVIPKYVPIYEGVSRTKRGP